MREPIVNQEADIGEGRVGYLSASERAITPATIKYITNEAIEISVHGPNGKDGAKKQWKIPRLSQLSTEQRMQELEDVSNIQ